MLLEVGPDDVDDDDADDDTSSSDGATYAVTHTCGSDSAIAPGSRPPTVGCELMLN